MNEIFKILFRQNMYFKKNKNKNNKKKSSFSSSSFGRRRKVSLSFFSSCVINEKREYRY